MKRRLLAACVLLTVATPLRAQSAADREAVRQAALDYVEGLYTADAARIEKSVHPELTKRGFWRKPADTTYGPQLTMTYEQLVELTKKWNKDGKQDLSIKEVTVLDVMDQTATAKVVANWGLDHMQLAKYDGRWKIINILWQAHPPKKAVVSKP